jgi:hypothetical protein
MEETCNDLAVEDIIIRNLPPDELLLGLNRILEDHFISPFLDLKHTLKSNLRCRSFRGANRCLTDPQESHSLHFVPRMGLVLEC